ncbi:hypothetical protein K503DRAFT_513349 [Rhizopogon vinicolor AM-OR11-026]|uniref:Uncharacterized protein n=1 Tax=Rhizopogon vinicolor AM-OR11-026 TaxID=1314800 RepID=A0A1B7MLX2_9AGAM|nr:hypothetical protein K503DRAFT_513349 [Rhizopogon vinicolor AM-OR11-026]
MFGGTRLTLTPHGVQVPVRESEDRTYTKFNIPATFLIFISDSDFPYCLGSVGSLFVGACKAEFAERARRSKIRRLRRLCNGTDSLNGGRSSEGTKNPHKRRMVDGSDGAKGREDWEDPGKSRGMDHRAPPRSSHQPQTVQKAVWHQPVMV